jgi:hypothetical protein
MDDLRLRDDYAELLEIFNRHIKSRDDCWEWTGPFFKKRGGYGSITIRRVPLISCRAHRFAWMLFHGPITRRQHVLHRCDNPRCVNPRHLFLGNQRINMRDKCLKGRQNQGEAHGTAILSEIDVRQIRSVNYKQRWLAPLYGVSEVTISDIRRRRSWTHI